jgi:5-deoxy-glucuronate isomerase
MCCELLTPDGNWSSYPPHRHDGVGDCLVNNEEIYYFRIGCTGAAGYASDGFAMHRTYTVAEVHGKDAEVDLAVHDGDVFLIPEGYHGPCVAAPGYPLYYLNVLAGPGVDRSMAFCDDPTHHWVRDAWTDQPLDPRCPMTSATGRLP